MKQPAPRVFTPGTGVAPPALTGREREQAALRQCLADLRNGAAPTHDVATIGPRGSGKTVLLNWFENACRDAGRIHVLRLAPSRVRTAADLIGLLLLPRSRLGRLLTRKPAAPAVAARNLTARLTARCRRRPVVVLVDEAHTLEREVGQLLLNVSQEVRAHAPFLLVLAGTPGLPAHLSAMNASFWGRLDAGRLGVGLLSEAAARAALRKPLAAHGVEIDPDALDAVVADSQRYPYFIQIWGRALWQQCVAGATRLTTAHADAARVEVAARVTDYCQDRLRELESAGLLAAGVAAARLFQSAAAADDHALDAALAATGADAAARLAARDGLNRLGYIWCPPGQLPPVQWVAGIPSLMAHVLDHGPASAAGA